MSSGFCGLGTGGTEGMAEAMQLLPVRREVQVNHRSLQRAVAQVLPDEPQIHTGFLQARRIAALERVQVNCRAELELLTRAVLRLAHWPANRMHGRGSFQSSSCRQTNKRPVDLP
jgi:hypothetical protein